MTAKFTGKIYRLSAFSALPLSARLASHWYARFGVCRGGGWLAGGFGKSGCVGTFIGVAEGLMEEGGAR